MKTVPCFFVLPGGFGPSWQVERQRNPAPVQAGFESCPRETGLHVYLNDAAIRKVARAVFEPIASIELKSPVSLLC